MFLSAAGKGEEGAFLRTRLSQEKVTEGESVTYEVVLFTPDPNVEGFELVSMPDFSGIDVNHSAPDRRLTQVELNGRKYYTAVVDRYFLRFPGAGKFNIKGGAYRLGKLSKKEYYDPFWGRTVGNVREAVNLTAPDRGVKVKSLPQRGKPDNFSGAVGDFDLTAEIAGGALRTGEDALLIVTISGIGSLQDVLLPDIRSQLPDDLQFKSMTDRVSHFVKDGELGTEVEIECTVMPKREGVFLIDALKFNFFDINSEQYKTITAPKIEIESESSLPGSGRPPVIMEI